MGGTRGKRNMAMRNMAMRTMEWKEQRTQGNRSMARRTRVWKERGHYEHGQKDKEVEKTQGKRNTAR